MTDFPNPDEFAAAYVRALQEHLQRQVVPAELSADAPVEPLPADVSVFAGGRFLPPGAAPDLPNRSVILRRAAFSRNEAYCPGHAGIEYFPWEVDNYGNVLLTDHQPKVYIIRSTVAHSTSLLEIIRCAGGTGWGNGFPPSGCTRSPTCTYTHQSGNNVYNCNNSTKEAKFAATFNVVKLTDSAHRCPAKEREDCGVFLREVAKVFDQVLAPLETAMRAAEQARGGSEPPPYADSKAEEPAAPAGLSVAAKLRIEMRAERAARERTIATLRAEMAALLGNLADRQEEAARLREELAAARSAAQSLKAEVAALQVVPAPQPGAPDADPRYAQLLAQLGGPDHLELEQLRERAASYERELEHARGQLQATQQELRAAARRARDTAAEVQRQQSAAAAELARLSVERESAVQKSQQLQQVAREAQERAAALLAAQQQPADGRDAVLSSLYEEQEQLTARAEEAERREAAVRAELQQATERLAQVRALFSDALPARGRRH